MSTTEELQRKYNQFLADNPRLVLYPETAWTKGYSQGYKDARGAAVQRALFEYSVGTNGLGIAEAIRSLPIPEAK